MVRAFFQYSASDQNNSRQFDVDFARKVAVLPVELFGLSRHVRHAAGRIRGHPKSNSRLWQNPILAFGVGLAGDRGHGAILLLACPDRDLCVGDRFPGVFVSDQAGDDFGRRQSENRLFACLDILDERAIGPVTVATLFALACVECDFLRCKLLTVYQRHVNAVIFRNAGQSKPTVFVRRDGRKPCFGGGLGLVKRDHCVLRWWLD